MRLINKVWFNGLLNLQLEQVCCEGGQCKWQEKIASMITLEIQEEILQIKIGLSGQWGILFGVEGRTFLTCNNLFAEEFCDLYPP